MNAKPIKLMSSHMTHKINWIFKFFNTETAIRHIAEIHTDGLKKSVQASAWTELWTISVLEFPKLHSIRADTRLKRCVLPNTQGNTLLLMLHLFSVLTTKHWGNIQNIHCLPNINVVINQRLYLKKVWKKMVWWISTKGIPFSENSHPCLNCHST